MGDNSRNPGLYLTPRYIFPYHIIHRFVTLFCSLIVACSKHRAKRSSGCGRESLGRQRQNIEIRSEPLSSRVRPRWRKEADIPQDTRTPGVLFDSTPLYSPPKASGIKSIEISIDKTGHKGKQRGARNHRGNTTSSEEDMLEDKEGTQIQNLFDRLFLEKYFLLTFQPNSF